VCDAPYELLQPLELAFRLFDEISMDFIVDLPVSHGFSCIWVIVDHFTTMSHIIPLKNAGKKAPDLIGILLREIWRQHGRLSTITSDSDTQFTSMVLKGIIDSLGIKPKMSSPIYSQTDAQTVRINQTLKCYL
jgi:hypothetical protein